MNRTKRAKKRKMTPGIKCLQKETLECRRVDGRGWDPKNRDIKSKRARTKAKRRNFRQPIAIHFCRSYSSVAVVPHPNTPCDQPTKCHLHTRTVLSIFKNIAFLLLKLLFSTLRRLHNSTVWEARFLATEDRKVSAAKRIHFLNTACKGEASKYIYIYIFKKTPSQETRTEPWLLLKPWNEVRRIRRLTCSVNC